MATFSLKKYASKIYAYELYNELFKTYKVSAFFEISDSVPRKAAIDIVLDTFKGLDIGKRIDIEKELAYIFTFSTVHAATLYKKLIEKELGVPFEPEIECASDADLVLYCYLRHRNLLEKVLFLHDFYMSKSYTSYEVTKSEDMAENEKSGEGEISFENRFSELTKDFERLANKDDNATECKMVYEEVDNILYLSVLFEGRYESAPKINKESGELDRTHSIRKVERIFICWVKGEERVLIRGTVGRNALINFLDSFLRIICDAVYEGKTESFDLDPFKNLSFDFTSFNKGTPLLRWKIKGIALSFANGKKKLRLALPSEVHASALAPLGETLNDLGMISKYDSFAIDSVTLIFTFSDKAHEGKSISVSTTLSPKKNGLCPLFTEHNYVRRLFTLSGVDRGFVSEGK